MDDRYTPNYIKKYYEASGNKNFTDSLDFIIHNITEQCKEYKSFFKDALDRRTVRTNLCERIKVIPVSPEEVDGSLVHFDGEYKFNDGLRFNEQGVSITKIKLPKDFEPQVITDSVTEPSVFLINNKDFIIDNNTLYIQAYKKLPLQKNVCEGNIVHNLICLNGITSMMDGLEAYTNMTDIDYIKDTNLLNIVWDLLIDGFSDKQLIRLCCALVDMDMPEEPSLVTDIRNLGKYKLIFTEDNVYRIPKTSSAMVAIGDTVKPYMFLSDCVSITYDSNICSINVKESCLSNNLTEEQFQELLDRLGSAYNKYNLNIIEE